MAARHDRHKDAMMYELYVRAFRDSNGDGHRDQAGVVERLDYLSWLGIDVVWLLPTYPSPLRDDGYDVGDFTNVHPDQATLGSCARLRPDNEAVLAFHDVYEDDVVISIHNRSDEPQAVVLDVGEDQGRRLRGAAITAEPLEPSASTRLRLAPYGLRWYVPTIGSPAA